MGLSVCVPPTCLLPYPTLSPPFPASTTNHPTNNRKQPPGNATPQVRKNLQRSLAFKIQKLSNTFRSQQKEYLHKLRAQKEGAMGQVSQCDVLYSRGVSASWGW